MDRSTGQRTVIDRHRLQGSVAEVAGRCRLRHQARIVKIQDGQERTYELRYGAEPIHLPGRTEKLWLVVIAGTPAVDGLGTLGGFKLQVEDRALEDRIAQARARAKFVEAFLTGLVNWDFAAKNFG